MKKNTSLIIADDHRLFSHTFSTFIKDNTECNVVKIVENGKQLLQALNEVKTDLILLDINMPILNGIEVAENVKSNYPEIKIIAISQYAEKQIIDKVMAMGVDGYFIKNNDPAEFLETLNKVLAGEKAFSQNKEKSAPVNIIEDPFEQRYQFTNREKEVLRLIKGNLSNKELAKKLFLSEYTIESHTKSICKKLNTSDRKVVYKFALDHF
jgi:DNA-binding NarL/FixJ family response regulator